MALSLKRGRDDVRVVRTKRASVITTDDLKQIKLLRAYHGCLGANRR